jgi:tripartite-type tricarboxylate transporter receptor subunit TctC
MDRRQALAGIGATWAALGVPHARAQAAWPTRPIAVTVGLQAGTGSDVAVRGVAEKLAGVLGQPVVIENVPGAGGVVAAGRVKQAPNDGHALFALSNGTLAVAPYISKVAYDPEKDLVPVAHISGFPSVLVVGRDFPARNVAEFVEVVRRNPGKYGYGTGGIGSVQHLAMEAFKGRTGTEMMHVPYKGSLQAATDIAGGQIHVMFNGISTVLPLVRGGQLKVLATSGDQRMALMPEVPTIHESGVANFFYEPWTGLYAPPGTPRAVVERLNAAVRRIVADPELKAKWPTQGLAGKDLSPEQMARLLRDEAEVNRKVIAEKGIKAE